MQSTSFLPYRDDPQVEVCGRGSRPARVVPLAEIARQHGSDVAYQYRAAAGVARARGLVDPLVITMECVPGQGELYSVGNLHGGTERTVVSLGRAAGGSAAPQMSLL